MEKNNQMQTEQTNQAQTELITGRINAMDLRACNTYKQYLQVASIVNMISYRSQLAKAKSISIICKRKLWLEGGFKSREEFGKSLGLAKATLCNYLAIGDLVTEDGYSTVFGDLPYNFLIAAIRYFGVSEMPKMLPKVIDDNHDDIYIEEGAFCNNACFVRILQKYPRPLEVAKNAAEKAEKRKKSTHVDHIEASETGNVGEADVVSEAVKIKVASVETAFKKIIKDYCDSLETETTLADVVKKLTSIL